MDSSGVRSYGSFKVEVNLQLEDYFGPDSIFESYSAKTVQVVRDIYNAFSGRGLSGSTVTDFSVGPNMAHLLAMKDFVQDITTVDMDAAAVKQVEKWKNKDPDAFDWSNVAEMLKDLKGNRDKPEDEEEDLRGKLKKPLWVDYNKGISSLLLPKADIVTSMCFLDAISKDHDEYRGNLKELCNLIKCGGYLLLWAYIDCSYFKVGDIKYHYLKCGESFYKKVIGEAGLDIKHCEKFDKVMSCDSADHKDMIFIIAQKV